MDAMRKPFVIPASLFGLLGFVIAVSGSPSVGQAATYYVDKTGSDSNSCAQATNPISPRQTINSGISCLSAGDTLIVKAGTYAESLTNPFSNTGNAWTNKITVKAESPRSVIIRPTGGEDAMGFYAPSQKYIEFDGIELDAINTSNYGVGIRGTAHHIRFINSAILNAGGEGVMIYGDSGDRLAPSFNEFINVEVAYTAMNPNGTTKPCYGSGSLGNGKCHAFYAGTNNNLLDRVHLHHNNGYGVQFYPQGNSANIIRNSRSHDNFSTGIGSFGDNNQIVNNIVYGNGDYGIWITNSGTKVYHNTVYNNQEGLILTGTGHSIKNNIIYESRASIDSTNLTANAQFLNAVSGDFHLQSGSSAIDKVECLTGITTDIEGKNRPQGSMCDVGAHEFGGTGADTVPPTTPSNVRVN